MIVISLALVIGAAVSLFIGLFVVTDTLTFIFAAIALCLLSLFLLWLGTRSRPATAPAAPAAPVYGGAARAGGSSAPARPARGDTDLDELDDLTSPDSGTVVRRTTARDRAATRAAPADGGTAAPAAPEPETVSTAPPAAGQDAEDPADDPVPATSTARKATAKRATARKATAKKATAKTATARKAPAKKATAGKAASRGSGTTGAAARQRLAEISGVGPAKQDALLAHYGSLEAIQQASVDDIVANVKGFGAALAARVKDELA